MTQSLLFDSPPRVFNSDLAVAIGLPKAIVLQQLHYWLQKSSHQRYGRKWVYNSYQDWQQNDFPWWSVSTVKRIFQGLEQDGLIQSGEYNQSRTDRTKWYTICYGALRCRVGQNDPLVVQSDPPSDPFWSALEGANLDRSYLENTKNSTEEDVDSSHQSILEQYNQICHALPAAQTLTEPRKQAITKAKDTWGDLEPLFQKVSQTAFLCGDNPRGWKATLDWLLVIENGTRVLEGVYDPFRPQERFAREDYRYEPIAVDRERFSFLTTTDK